MMFLLGRVTKEFCNGVNLSNRQASEKMWSEAPESRIQGLPVVKEGIKEADKHIHVVKDEDAMSGVLESEDEVDK